MLKRMLLQNWLEVTKVAWMLIFLLLMLPAWIAPNSFISPVLSVCGMALSIVIVQGQTFLENQESK